MDKKGSNFLHNAMSKSAKLLASEEQKISGETHKDNIRSLGSQCREANSQRRSIIVLKGNTSGFNLCSAANDGLLRNSEESNDKTHVLAITNGRMQKHVADQYLNGRLSRRPLHPEGTNEDNKCSSQMELNAKGEKLVICPNCGTLSADFKYCDSCQRSLPENAKIYSKKTESSSEDRKPLDKKLSKQAFYGRKLDEQRFIVDNRRAGTASNNVSSCNRLASLRTARKKIVHEPVCLTISSDEEGDNDREINKLNNIVNPALYDESPWKDECSGEEMSLKKRKLVDSFSADTISDGENCLPLQQTPTRLLPTNPQQHYSPDNSLCVTEVSLQCRSIRIGSYKIIKSSPVKISAKGISFQVTPVEDARSVQLIISPKDLVKVMVNFSPAMPVLFLYTTPGFGGLVRSHLNMSSRKGPYYDPGSTNETEKRITLLPECLTEEEQEAICIILTKFSPDELLTKIDSKAANSILIRSTPTEVQTIVRLIAGPEKSCLHAMDTVERNRPETVIRPPSVTVKLMTYPPPPQTGGITITSDDYGCLEEGQFLNDVIIDFYLKYLVQNLLDEIDRKRTHIFSSFFYRRLTQRPSRKNAYTESPRLSAAENRHSRVKTWTRHIDIFDKDFVIIPINESSHWFLAVICFPYLEGPVPFQDEVKESKAEDNVTPMELDEEFNSTMENISLFEDARSDNVNSSNIFADSDPSDELCEESLNSNLNNSLKTGPTPVKQPCILIFDSLRGSGRGKIVHVLREYLQIEWEVRKKSKRSFNKELMNGCIPEVPQQSNYSDCGIYLLQYVESFFETPIQDYKLPMKQLKNWFTEEHVGTKRDKLRGLIYDLMSQQNSKNLLPLVISDNEKTNTSREQSFSSSNSATKTNNELS